ncbi:hypothetical protein Vadar_021820 [Vaccinium darrowii]|uniref:Uncharacterized protein n=1 Tax=Vaccinium darrowii TaxID=229202 RepID=A0ACB7YNS2_9ERIC|nr:hypothetical protein Vadar_021820 [Vaccinium darrowii]
MPSVRGDVVDASGIDESGTSMVALMLGERRLVEVIEQIRAVLLIRARVSTAMEATRDAQGLLDKIRPPRLDDASLEDCALPPDSIKEAFLRAATAISSRGASVFSSNSEEEEEGRSCVEDPWGEEKLGDDLVGVREGVDSPPGDCMAEKGGGLGEVMGDEVVAGLTEAKERRGDKVVDGREGVEEEGGEACVVDGLKGLKIGEKEGGNNGEGEEDEGGSRPILGETFV